MPICRYFQTNSCRYGSSCRFEHVREKNPYVYDARSKGEGVSILQRFNQPPPRSANTISSHREDLSGGNSDVSRYFELVKADVQEIERCHIWPLTSLGLGRGFGGLPGWTDYSPEEIRFEAYKYQQEGNFEKYVFEVKSLLDKAKELRSIFSRPNKMAEEVVQAYLKQRFNNSSISEPIFSTVVPKPSSASATFSFAQGLPPQNAQPTSNPSSTFSFASHPAFNTQAARGPSPTSIFGQTGLAPTQNIFGQVPPMQNAPAQFGIAQTTQQSSFSSISTMETSLTSFGNVPLKDKLTGVDRMVEVRIYSKLEDLSKEEREQFQANTFTFGKVPLNPPPRELC